MSLRCQLLLHAINQSCSLTGCRTEKLSFQFPAALELAINNYLLYLLENDLRARVPPSYLHRKLPIYVLDRRNIRWTYHPDRQAVHIRMPSALHDAFFWYMPIFLDNCRELGLFTKQQKSLYTRHKPLKDLLETLYECSIYKKQVCQRYQMVFLKDSNLLIANTYRPSRWRQVSPRKIRPHLMEQWFVYPITVGLPLHEATSHGFPCSLMLVLPLCQ